MVRDEEGIAGERWLARREEDVLSAWGKDDEGKLRLSLVPVQIIKDIAEVREYGSHKYGGVESWRYVEWGRYVDAFFRHWLEFLRDPKGIDEESGLAHYKHCACNLAFLCELLAGQQVFLQGKGEGE